MAFKLLEQEILCLEKLVGLIDLVYSAARMTRSLEATIKWNFFIRFVIQQYPTFLVSSLLNITKVMKLSLNLVA